MPIFLHEPHYFMGMGYLTEPRWTRRIYRLGLALSVIILIASICVGIAPSPDSRGMFGIVMVAASWFGLSFMRLVYTGAMWVFSVMWDALTDVWPAWADFYPVPLRAYWICLEIFLSGGLLGILTATALAVMGIWPIEG